MENYAAVGGGAMSLPRYLEYKASGVEWLGEVPKHWEVVQFKQFVDIQNGSDHKHIEQAEGYPVLGSGGIFTYASDFLYDGESVLLGRKGTINKPLYITGRFWTVDTMYWTKISPDASGRFAYYSALTIPFDYYSTNTALPSMTKGALSGHLVTRPPLTEQIQIAAFLDSETSKIDALIAEQRRLVELLAEKRQAVISHAVTKGLNLNVPMKDSGIEWLGEVPEHWYVCGLKRFCDVRDGTHDTPEFVDPDVDTAPMVTSKDLVNGEIVFEDAKHISMADCFEIAKRSGVAIGDLLMPMIGSIGGAVIVETEQVFAIKNIALFKNSKHHHNHWLKHVLNSDLANYQFELSRSGGVQGFVGLGTLRNLTFAFPSIDEQQIIAIFLANETAKFDTLITESNHAIELLQERRSALISAAVTGKIDVRKAA
jgi:type I restriction enzyme S subunit